jgi:predicted cupin superfamily sugar epimerase
MNTGFGRTYLLASIRKRSFWQAARSMGAWTLAGATVAPGFDFAGFEIAPEGWEP